MKKTLRIIIIALLLSVAYVPVASAPSCNGLEEALKRMSSDTPGYDQVFQLAVEMGCVQAVEREALIALYNSTGGPNWTLQAYFLTDKPHCEWNEPSIPPYWFPKGALCYEGRVRSVRLWDNNLNGTIPPEIGNLTNLIWLWMDANNLYGPLPVELMNIDSVASTSRETVWLSEVPLDPNGINGICHQFNDTWAADHSTVFRPILWSGSWGTWPGGYNSIPPCNY